MGIKDPFNRVTGLGGKFIIDGNKNQGALSCGNPNFSESSGVSPLIKRVLRTSFGSRALSLAVWMIVGVMRDTFFVPWRERFPKIIFLRMTKFLKALSALLLVGSISGCFKEGKYFVLLTMEKNSILNKFFKAVAERRNLPQKLFFADSQRWNLLSANPITIRLYT